VNGGERVGVVRLALSGSEIVLLASAAFIIELWPHTETARRDFDSIAPRAELERECRSLRAAIRELWEVQGLGGRVPALTPSELASGRAALEHVFELDQSSIAMVASAIATVAEEFKSNWHMFSHAAPHEPDRLNLSIDDLVALGQRMEVAAAEAVL